MNITLLYNDSAGDGVALGRLRRQIEQGGHQLVHFVENADDLARGLDEHPTEAVVAAGGDGTVWRAVSVLAGRKVPLAVLPLGTANNIARSLGIEGSEEEVIESWHHAHRVPLDLGVLQGPTGERRFVEAVGGGLIPAGIAAMEQGPQDENEGTDEKLTRARERYHEVLSRLDPRWCRLTVDGTRQEGAFLLVEVLNIRSVGPNLVLSPDALPSDGLFSVVTAEEAQRDALARYLRHRANDRDTRLELPTRLAREIEIEGCDEWHIDDEIHRWPPEGPVSIRMEAAALQALVPPGYGT